MRRFLLLILAFTVVVVPALALAADTDLPVIHVGSGVIGEIAGKTLGIARTYLPFMFVLAFVIEAFGTPTASKDYGATVWRALIIAILLSANPLGGTTPYNAIFGRILSYSASIADGVTPKDTWTKFGAEMNKYLQDKYNEKPYYEAGKPEEQSSFLADVKKLTKWGTEYMGSQLFTGLLSMAILVCQAIDWCFNSLSAVLGALLFSLGPLALVFGVPRQSGSVGRWLTAYITVAVWPIISGLILAIVSSIGIKSFRLTGPFGALAPAMLMAASALATPVVASAIVGGAIKDVISPGLRALANCATLGGEFLRTGVGAAGTAVGAVANAGIAAGSAAAPAVASAAHASLQAARTAIPSNTVLPPIASGAQLGQHVLANANPRQVPAEAAQLPRGNFPAGPQPRGQNAVRRGDGDQLERVPPYVSSANPPSPATPPLLASAPPSAPTPANPPAQEVAKV